MASCSDHICYFKVSLACPLKFTFSNYNHYLIERISSFTSRVTLHSLLLCILIICYGIIYPLSHVPNIRVHLMLVIF